jgi:hypothetical protein
MEELLRLYSKRAKGKGRSSESDKSFFRLYFVNPFSAGLFGFAVFFFFIIVFEEFAHVIGFLDHANIGLTEISISTIGFVLQFTFQILINFK